MKQSIYLLCAVIFTSCTRTYDTKINEFGNELTKSIATRDSVMFSKLILPLEAARQGLIDSPPPTMPQEELSHAIQNFETETYPIWRHLYNNQFLLNQLLSQGKEQELLSLHKFDTTQLDDEYPNSTVFRAQTLIGNNQSLSFTFEYLIIDNHYYLANDKFYISRIDSLN